MKFTLPDGTETQACMADVATTEMKAKFMEGFLKESGHDNKPVRGVLISSVEKQEHQLQKPE